ncbi:WXG100-like domain-containing protein [Nonomuraea roseola]|uniref:Outer membrane channel protein CpnT-like N-terminal domain-containing protein n=1 Tax=Nonomuraea roseola TaxID=46179 RepID=A0ABV5PQH3_9ACTN
MARESNTYQIKAGAVPDAGAVTASAEQIKKWLNDTNPAAIVQAADAYSSAASMIKLARDSLLTAATGLSEMWGGPTAALFQKSLKKLDHTGLELVTKMEQMAKALDAYGATHLPAAIEKVEVINPVTQTFPSPSPGLKPTIGTSPTIGASPGSGSSGAAPTPGLTAPPINLGEDPITANFRVKQDQRAQQILQDLNKQILDLYQSGVPDDISYDLEIPAPPSGADYRRTSVSFEDRSSSSSRNGSFETPSFRTDDYSPGSGGSNGSGGGPSGDVGPGGTAPGGGPGGGDTTPPQNPDRPGTNPGPGSPGDTDPNSPGAGGGNDTGAGTGDGTGNGTGAGPGGSNGSGTGTGTGKDGTTPPVIGHNDPGQTETATYNPTQTTSPTPQTSTPFSHVPPTAPQTISTPPATPNTFVTPTNGTTGVPSVLGAPGQLAGQGALTSAASRGAFGSGMPLLPMGGMGAIGGEANEDSGRTTALREDSNPWAPPHDVTNPYLGLRDEA